jgi:hypothetical protein
MTATLTPLTEGFLSPKAPYWRFGAIPTSENGTLRAQKTTIDGSSLKWFLNSQKNSMHRRLDHALIATNIAQERARQFTDRLGLNSTSVNPLIQLNPASSQQADLPFKHLALSIDLLSHIGNELFCRLMLIVRSSIK